MKSGVEQGGAAQSGAAQSGAGQSRAERRSAEQRRAERRSAERRSSREHAQRATTTTDQSLKDDYQTRAAQSLERARQCDAAMKYLLTHNSFAPRAPARARTADHGGADLVNNDLRVG